MLSLRQAGILDVTDEVVRSSTGLAGEVGGKWEMCGAVISGIQAIGLKYGRVDKSVDRKPAMEQSGKLIDEFRERFGSLCCHELVKDFPDFNSRERKDHCAQFVAFVAEWLEPVLKALWKRP